VSFQRSNQPVKGYPRISGHNAHRTAESRGSPPVKVTKKASVCR